jgi:hypothetical protein
VQVDTLRDQLAILEKKLRNSQDQYRRFAMEECDLNKEQVDAKIKEAKSAPSTNARLLRIHNDWKAVCAKKEEIQERAITEPALHDTNAVSKVSRRKVSCVCMFYVCISARFYSPYHNSEQTRKVGRQALYLWHGLTDNVYLYLSFRVQPQGDNNHAFYLSHSHACMHSFT